jgi:signal transduction histidine kinase
VSRAAAQHRRAPGALRGRGQGGHRTRLVPQLQLQPRSASSISSPSRSASCSTRSKRTCGRRRCSSSRSPHAGAPVQQQELTETNQRLEQQARSLQESEDLLKRSRRNSSRRTSNSRRRRAAGGAEVGGRAEEPRDRARPQAIEEKAEQLALTSKYKSEFLANMSPRAADAAQLDAHPLENALRERGRDADEPKQVEFAETIFSSGSDLLALINEILDLSKIESGTMAVDIEDFDLESSTRTCDACSIRSRDEKGSSSTSSRGLPPQTIETDAKRLQQVLKNLLSNAFKFTHEGSVTLRIDAPEPRASVPHRDPQPSRRRHRVLRRLTPASASPPRSRR